MLARTLIVLGLLAAILLPGGCAAPHASAGPDWRDTLRARLPAYGHRNIIAVVDSAYPSQSRAGVEMVVTGQDHLTVLNTVLKEIAAHPHVRARALTDAELPYVAEADAPGIAACRADLARALEGTPTRSMPHAEVIESIDQASQTFNVLLLKTDLKLPYTSVFIWLDCGYWSDEAESRLRAAMRPERP